jgi:hypothetical protein
VDTRVNIIDRLNAVDNTGTEGSNSSGGGRGFWPGDDPDLAVGESVKVQLEVLITGLVLDEEGMEIWAAKAGSKDREPTGQFNPAYYFTYQVAEGAGSAINHPEWDGRPINGERWIANIHDTGEQLSKGAQTARKMATERWAGFVELLLGRQAGKLGPEISEIQQIFENMPEGEGLPAVVEFTVAKRAPKDRTGEGRKGQDSPKARKYYAEYLNQLLDDQA